MVIFPLAPDQTIAQMWSNGARGGILERTNMLRTSRKISESSANESLIIWPRYFYIPSTKLFDRKTCAKSPQPTAWI